ncbi:hypothetical protein BDQ17DRAFT_1345941 [Cyathus striatus]|nr:hypothetical protein BDQ17DRAFT_1345941 [Cyathus striatus]
MHQPPTLNKSVYDDFPLVEAGIILDIARHDFRPLDLYKLDYPAKPASSSSRSYPTFTSLLSPLTVYFNILSTLAAATGKPNIIRTVADGAFCYISHLSDLSQRYEWGAVLQYHMDFHLDRRREMANGSYAGWKSADGQLINTHLVHRLLPITRYSNTSTSRNRSTKSLPRSAQTCFNFNKGSCTSFPCPAGRIHRR